MTSSKTPERLLFIPTTTEKLKEVLDGGLFPLISEALVDDLDDKLLFQSIATRILNKDFDLLIAAMWLRARKGHKFNFAEYQIEDYMYDVVSSALEVCFHHYPSLSQYSHGPSIIRDELTKSLNGEVLERIVGQIQKLYNSPDAVGEVIAADQPPAESLFRRVRSFNWWHSNDQTFSINKK